VTEQQPPAPGPPGHAIRKARGDEVAALAEMLGRAFFDDPIATWVEPDDGRRERGLRRGFALGLRAVWFRQEETYAIDPAAGAAIWMRPGGWRMGALRQLSLLPRLTAIYGRRLPALVRLLTLQEHNHPKREPHYYLAVLGVDPESQGRGIGTALMRPILDRCDRDGLPAYLEASSVRSRACYERVGFEVTEEVPLPGDGPPFWSMWREPQAAR
jgi:ribosomal protein S18 acetylase RimI-like enzyme